MAVWLVRAGRHSDWLNECQGGHLVRKEHNRVAQI